MLSPGITSGNRQMTPPPCPGGMLGLPPRGWLDSQALVLPYSTSWEKARREAVAVMGYTDRVQL